MREVEVARRLRVMADDIDDMGPGIIRFGLQPPTGDVCRPADREELRKWLRRVSVRWEPDG